MSDDEREVSRQGGPTINTSSVDPSSSGSSTSSSSGGSVASPPVTGASMEEAEPESDNESDEANDNDDAGVEESDDESPTEAANEDEEFRLGEDDDIDDEDKAAMFNLVMNEVLRQYREENGRGPDTKELLEMRAAIAQELDVKVAEIDADQADWNKRADGTPAKNRPKTIGFHNEDKVLEYEPHPNEHTHDYEDERNHVRVHGNEDDDDDDEGGESSEDDDRTSNLSEPPRKRLKTKDTSRTKPEEEIEDSKPAARPSLPRQSNGGENIFSTESTTTTPSNYDYDDGASSEDDDRTSNLSEPPRKRLKTKDTSKAKPDEEIEDSKPAARPSASLPASRQSNGGDNSLSTESTTTTTRYPS